MHLFVTHPHCGGVSRFFMDTETEALDLLAHLDFDDEVEQATLVDDRGEDVGTYTGGEGFTWAH
jgi:hypothetical protein